MKSTFRNRWFTLCLLGTFMIALAGETRAQRVSSASVSHLGLTVEWSNQLDIGPRTMIAGVTLHVNENESDRYYEVNSKWRIDSGSEGETPVYSTQREVIYTTDISAFGTPYGDEGALNHANIRRDVIEAELNARDRKEVEVTVNAVRIQNAAGETIEAPLTIPKTFIYATTTSGQIAKINAETGKTLWKSQLGDGRFTVTGPGASDSHVAACSGSTLHCLNADNGKIIWSVKSKGAPASAPVISEHAIFVALTNGKLEAFPLQSGIGAQVFTGSGTVVAPPLLTERSVSWATLDGFYSVIPLTSERRSTFSQPGPEEPLDGEPVDIATKIAIARYFLPDSISYRLRADAEILSPGTAAGENLFVTASDGFIYALNERTGGILWEFSTGERIEQSAIPYKGNLYCVTVLNQLYQLNTLNGAQARSWRSPVEGVARFLAASGNNIFVQDVSGNLGIVNAESGSLIGTAPMRGIDFSIHNTQTNRIYLGNNRGMLQCIREISSPDPVFHLEELAPAEIVVDIPPPTVTGAANGNAPAPSGNNPFNGNLPAPSGSNPFGGNAPPAGGSNPFGGNAPATGGSNPFGGTPAPSGGNPFGTGGGSGGANPFGTGGGGNDSNPFGTGGGGGNSSNPFGG